VKAAAALVLLLAGCGAPAAQGSASPLGVPTYHRSEFGTGWAQLDPGRAGSP
jgi:hypothetical protein